MVSSNLLSSTKPTDAKFDPSALISAGLDVVSGLVVKQKALKDQKALEIKIQALNFEQKKELEAKVKSVEGEIAQMQILFKTLAIYENQKELQKYNKQKTTQKIILASGFGLLISIIILVKLKQHE